ncbi:hypothetical protein BHE74_00011653 [Ensete ventricosum]|nr:hypothetical protein BHE74_00011653 [Ensete ventricosum]
MRSAIVNKMSEKLGILCQRYNLESMPAVSRRTSSPATPSLHGMNSWSLTNRCWIFNAGGVTKNFFTGDSLPPWHEELEPRKPLLDISQQSRAYEHMTS